VVSIGFRNHLGAPHASLGAKLHQSFLYGTVRVRDSKQVYHILSLTDRRLTVTDISHSRKEGER
jgi:hypothetical protein